MVADPGSEASARENQGRSLGRSAGFVLSFLVSSAGLVAGIFALVETIPPKPWQTPIGVMDRILPELDALASSAGSKGLRRIAMLGDSTVDSYAGKKKIPVRLEEALLRSAREPKSVRVSNLSFPALGSTSYYFLADRVISARPDLVVWEISLTHASERWRRSIPRPELAGWMAPSRIAATIPMPIQDIGLTVDELLLYQLIVQTGSGEVWRDWLVDLSRVDKAKGELEEWMSSHTEHQPERHFGRFAALRKMSKLMEGGELDRYNRLGEIEHFGKVLAGIGPEHPTLRFIAATTRLFKESGIPLFVYLNPINVEHLDKVGVIEEEKFQRTVRAFREILTREGANFLDLHDRFPDAHFSDMAGHFRHDEELEAQTELANLLAAFIIDEDLLGPNFFVPGRKD